MAARPFSPTVSSSEEIEVEVVEVGINEPASRPDKPARGIPQNPFGGRLPIRSLRIPSYLWPVAIVLGLILLMIGILLALVLIIPFLILRAIVRLLR